MIGTSLHELVFIRICIFLLQWAPLLYTILLFINLLALSATQADGAIQPRWLLATAYTLATLLTIDIIFGIAFYLPHKRRLRKTAVHPTPLTSAERKALFARCTANVPDGERYLKWWFLGAEPEDIKRDNVRDFFLWAFFGRKREDEELAEGRNKLSEEDQQELEGYIDEAENLLGGNLQPGRGKATALRLTFDSIETRYRTALWYFIVGLVDLLTHLSLGSAGYQYYGLSVSQGLRLVPPRLQTIPARVVLGHKSPSNELGYMFRPHTSKKKLPVVFLHGIGIGLWAYKDFLAELAAEKGDDGQIGILAIELLPISMRLTTPPLDRDGFLREIKKILSHHGWDTSGFVLVSHSYGSVLTTHMLRDPSLGPLMKGLLLIDPVSVCLHLPDVAYNFTRRPPRRANEWQLWYFASMDVGVSEALGRHFFWQENVVWKDELLRLNLGETSTGQDKDTQGGDSIDGSAVLIAIDDDPDEAVNPTSQHSVSSGDLPNRRIRRVAVSFGGRDLIVDTLQVARYVVCAGNLEDWDAEDDDQLSKAFEKRPRLNEVVPSPGFRTRSGIEMLWFPKADHAQVFDANEDRAQLLGIIRRFCSLEG
jgi:pimeloyl-ACP methyl ester carboxylesterase